MKPAKNTNTCCKGLNSNQVFRVGVRDCSASSRCELFLQVSCASSLPEWSFRKFYTHVFLQNLHRSSQRKFSVVVPRMFCASAGSRSNLRKSSRCRFLYVQLLGAGLYAQVLSANFWRASGSMQVARRQHLGASLSAAVLLFEPGNPALHRYPV